MFFHSHIPSVYALLVAEGKIIWMICGLLVIFVYVRFVKGSDSIQSALSLYRGMASLLPLLSTRMDSYECDCGAVFRSYLDTLELNFDLADGLVCQLWFSDAMAVTPTTADMFTKWKLIFFNLDFQTHSFSQQAVLINV